MTKTVRIQASEITPVLESILLQRGFSSERAELCARLFTETSLDGVASHGLNRFPLFIEFIEKGIVKPASEPGLVRSLGHFETWDGNLGPGNLNAWACMDRAIQLAGESGMAAVALRNTNHWMRGGSYGLQAAQADCIGVCMTNTKPNMPPWGSREAKLGNNPFVISVPNEPYPMLLDMAMSQFSYGKMEVLDRLGEKLPFVGGFDAKLELSDEPGVILASELALPMGYWKGSGLAMMIDLLVATLSGGQTTREIGDEEEEFGLSQLFIAFDLGRFTTKEDRSRVIEAVTGSLLEAAPMADGGRVFYPGQQSWLRRQENERNGIAVDGGLWKRLVRLAQ